MRKCLLIGCIGSLALSACTPQAAPTSNQPHTLASPDTTTPEATPPHQNYQLGSGGEVIALIRGHAITAEQLQRPVFEAYGLRFLLFMAKLDLIKEKAREAGLTVTPDDIAAEHTLTLNAWFGSAIRTNGITGTEEDKQAFRRKQAEQLLPQFLFQQRLTMQEFNIGVETSAYIRKLAESQIKGKITEDMLREAFNIEYGEKIVVRHIQVANTQEMAEVQRRLANGEKFEDVARALSRDEASAKLGGELRPFSRAEKQWPDVFVQAAFSLKPGEVSDPVNTGKSLHLIKLMERIKPSAVRFEDNREFVYRKLYNAMLTVGMRQLQEAYATEVSRDIKIQDPFLARQFREQLDMAKGDTHPDSELVRRQIEINRTGAATQPANPEATIGRPEVARPPATMPGK